MRKIVTIVFGLVWALGFASPQSVTAQTLSDQVDELLRNRIEAARIPPKIIVEGEPIHASVALPLFYERRVYQPAWSNADGSLHQLNDLAEAIREADCEGLQAGDYHLAKIETLLSELEQNTDAQKPLNLGRLVDLDLLATDAFLVYGSHLLAGRVNPAIWPSRTSGFFEAGERKQRRSIPEP